MYIYRIIINLVKLKPASIINIIKYFDKFSLSKDVIIYRHLSGRKREFLNGKHISEICSLVII